MINLIKSQNSDNFGKRGIEQALVVRDLFTGA